MHMCITLTAAFDLGMCWNNFTTRFLTIGLQRLTADQTFCKSDYRQSRIGLTHRHHDYGLTPPPRQLSTRPRRASVHRSVHPSYRVFSNSNNRFAVLGLGLFHFRSSFIRISQLQRLQYTLPTDLTEMLRTYELEEHQGRAHIDDKTTQTRRSRELADLRVLTEICLTFLMQIKCYFLLLVY